jgi:hypothetical protein
MDNQPEPPSAIEAKCLNCQAWQKIDPPGPRVIGEGGMGQCWMLPPTPAPMYTRDMAGVRGQVNIRPIMKEHDRCGMFVLREDLIKTAG